MKTLNTLNRIIIFLLIFITSFQLTANTPAGFDSLLAVDLSQLCTSYTFLDLYGHDDESLPDGYKKIHTSDVLGMDNVYQIYQHKNSIVINYRGSTEKQISWLENIQVAMIPANGTIEFNDTIFTYRFAKNPQAAVHGGYALALAYIAQKLLPQIQSYNQQGFSTFYITGHSQGGALSNMTKAYLENLPEGTFTYPVKFYSYAFAAPMVGNRVFVQEYNERYCNTNASFNIINPLDFIPKLPINFNDTSTLVQNFHSLFEQSDTTRYADVLAREAYRLFRPVIVLNIKIAGSSLNYRISTKLGNVKLPPFTDDVNFERISNIIELVPFEYPKVLKDSSVIKNDSLRAVFATDEEYFEDSYLKKGSVGFQHKPYNYYVGMLYRFNPVGYEKLHKKTLPENL